jgi:hypothetical protein
MVHGRELATDVLGAETGGDIEEYASVRAAPAGLHLTVDGACHLVAGEELRWAPVVGMVVVPAVTLGLRIRGFGREHFGDVVEHEPLAVRVAEDTPVAAYGLGDEEAPDRHRPHHAGGMELDALHLDGVGAGPQGHRHTVAGRLPRVGGVHPAPADAASGQNHRLGGEGDELAARAPVADRAGDDPVSVAEEPEDLHLHEDLDPVGHRLLLQGPDQLETGPVPHVGQAGVAMATEVALEDQPVLGPIEEGAPLLELADSVGGLLGVQLSHPPVVEHLPAAHGVAEVDLPVVLGVDVPESGGHTTLGHHRMGLAQQGLAHQSGAQPLGIRFDGGSETGATGTDDDDVEVVGFVLRHVFDTP